VTWIHERIYAAGGEYIPKNWASFLDQTGVSAVLHLNPEQPAKFLGPLPVCFLWMNLKGEKEAGLGERWLAAEFIGKNIEAGRSVLIHSSLRLHRVRWMYVAYLIWNGKGIQASLREVEQKPWLAPYHTDQDAWEEFQTFITAR
jgi:hypothetical protein